MTRYRLTIAPRQQPGLRIPDYMLMWEIRDASTGEYLGNYAALAAAYWNGGYLVPISGFTSCG